MTSPDDVIFLKFSEIHGQYFPLSNFKKKDTLVFSSLSSIRLGLSPKGLVKRKRPSRPGNVWQNINNSAFDVSKATARSPNQVLTHVARATASQLNKPLFSYTLCPCRLITYWPARSIFCISIRDAHRFHLTRCLRTLRARKRFSATPWPRAARAKGPGQGNASPVNRFHTAKWQTGFLNQ